MKTTNYGTRIIGGDKAPHPIPWQVYGKDPGCGGTILDSTTILSAAHCPFEVGGIITAGSYLWNGAGIYAQVF